MVITDVKMQLLGTQKVKGKFEDTGKAYEFTTARVVDESGNVFSFSVDDEIASELSQYSLNDFITTTLDIRPTKSGKNSIRIVNLLT